MNQLLVLSFEWRSTQRNYMSVAGGSQSPASSQPRLLDGIDPEAHYTDVHVENEGT